MNLGEKSIGKLLIDYSIPAIIGTMIFAAYNIVDRIFIGRYVGTLALSGVSVTFPVFTIIVAFGMLIGMGASSLISIQLGKKDKEQAENILSNAVTLFIVIAIIMSILSFIFIDQLLYLFGATDKTIDYAHSYAIIIFPFFAINFISFGMNNIIRSEGNPKIAMKTSLIGGVLNLILDPIFILYFDMGVKGAALATVISNIISASWVIYHFTKSPKRVLTLSVKKMRLKMDVVLKILAIGVSPFLMQIAASLVGVVSNRTLLEYGGEVAIAAMGVIHSVASIIFLPILGVNQGCRPIIGYNYGAKNYSRVQETLKLTIIIATGIAVLGFILIMGFPNFMISLFSKGDKELISIGTEGMRLFFLFIFLIGFQNIGAIYFLAIGNAKISTLLNLLRQVILFIPFMIIFPIFMGLKGVWIAGSASDFGAFLITYFFINKERKRLSYLSKRSI
ncbi:MATE family efflux transporter [bacterium]|nr:MATE family efflux transporter [bacterium]